MSQDLTKKLPRSDGDMLNLILTSIQSLEGRFEKLEVRVENIDARLQRLEAKAERLEQKVERLDEKVEQRLYDTRPIWHKVVADIAQLQAGQQRLEQSLENLRVEVSEVRRDQIVINDSLRKIQLDFHNIDQRLYRLEVNRTTPN